MSKSAYVCGFPIVDFFSYTPRFCISTHFSMGKPKKNDNNSSVFSAAIMILWIRVTHAVMHSLSSWFCRQVRSLTFVFIVKLLSLKTRPQSCMKFDWRKNVLKNCAVQSIMIPNGSSMLYRLFLKELSTSHLWSINGTSMFRRLTQ